MRIIIVGAGAVGSYLAGRLSGEGQDVLVIEADEDRAAELQDSIDALVMVGNGASITTLEKAGVSKSDLLIAVSNSDGANILACNTAHQLGVKRTVARIEDPGLREGVDRLGVDVVIDPSATASEELVALVRQTGVSELVYFADGDLVLVGGTVAPNSPLARAPLHQLRLRQAEWGWVVAAIVRHGETIVAHGDTEVRAGDHALLMTTAAHVDRATALLGLERLHVDRVILMGSTRLSELTADAMARAGFSVVMVDPDRARCGAMAARHPKAVVVHGDPTDPAVMTDLEIGSSDAVLALTGWDEVNITACLVAKAMGAASTVARFNRIDYVSLLAGVGIDAAVSSRLLAASAILRFVRHGDIQQVVAFSDTDAEAIEVDVAAGAPAVGASLIELTLPRGVVVGGISRGGTTFVPDGSTRIREGDRIIFFSLPDNIEESSQLFAP
ncbi:MAG TPA: Trk system potassium transporter TrkA [Acidimicrobiia bacterium]|nr:Trk system potassium transporter TrkA [Acidimicrobiia bacterium]